MLTSRKITGFMTLAAGAALLAAPLMLSATGVAADAEEQAAATAEATTPAAGETRARAVQDTSGPPPKPLKLVGDHWTPYTPPDPESFPEGSTIHSIASGDTLWALAGRYLEDPFLWPVIWDANQYITDSHWIYPGDPLLIPGKPMVVAETGAPGPGAVDLLAPLPAGAGRPGTGDQIPTFTTPPAPSAVMPAVPQAAEVPSLPAPPTASAPRLAPGTTEPMLRPVADEDDIYCSSYIVDEYAAPGLVIRDSEEGAKEVLGEGDVVFLNHGLDARLAAGDEFTVLLREGVVAHPIFDEVVGESVRMVGRVRVIALQESSATALIVQSCDAVMVGMDLVPFQEIASPIAAPVAFRQYGVQIDTARAGYIVDSLLKRESLAEGDIVNIDLGSSRGVRAGDVLTVFREWGGSMEFATDDMFVAGQQARAERNRQLQKAPENYAQTILGQIVILRTWPTTATGKIVLATREITLGDRVSPE